MRSMAAAFTSSKYLRLLSLQHPQSDQALQSRPQRTWLCCAVLCLVLCCGRRAWHLPHVAALIWPSLPLVVNPVGHGTHKRCFFRPGP